MQFIEPCSGNRRIEEWTQNRSREVIFFFNIYISHSSRSKRHNALIIYVHDDNTIIKMASSLRLRVWIRKLDINIAKRYCGEIEILERRFFCHLWFCLSVYITSYESFFSGVDVGRVTISFSKKCTISNIWFVFVWVHISAVLRPSWSSHF